ncbi:cytochrome P450 [Myriangium duriaei CBS 260.36]|uniref:Cytochrome P450 n=1 Tax=Myriangium duriaei CBS 260.36 TaxID=1168546 RepID=A0A9P4J9L3_9PEZI|nr:cytochrome P450 [Myriangium duriaei CBS 260.36]
MAVLADSKNNAPPMYAIPIILGVLYLLHKHITTYLHRRRISRENGCLPIPRWPAWDPILGIDVLQGLLKDAKAQKALEGFEGKFKTMGTNTFAIGVSGKTDICTIEPENLKTIQSLRFKDYSLGHGREAHFIPCLGRGVFTNNGTEWQHSREMLRPNFARDRVRDLDTFEVHIRHLLDAIPTDGSVVDLSDLFFRLTMDSSTEFLFGESTGTLTPGLEKASGSQFALAFNRAQEFMSWLVRYGNFAWMVPRRQFKQDIKVIQDFVDTYVEKGLARRSQVLAEKSDHYLFLDELVRQTTDRYRIRSELLNILLAGRDTTASLLTNVWWIMSKHQNIWNKLKAEVELLGGRHPTFEEMREMKYLQAILKESLRLHPQVAFNFREAVVDTVLPLGGGPDGKSPCLVRKGQNVSWSNYAMHRRTDFFGEDAAEFRPERWIDEGLRPGWEYLPFNGGPRICLGQQFALNEASYTTVRLVQEFSGMISRDPEPWRESLTLTCVGLGGCKISMIPTSKA